MDFEKEIKDQMIERGFIPPDRIVFDGKFHNFRAGDCNRSYIASTKFFNGKEYAFCTWRNFSAPQAYESGSFKNTLKSEDPESPHFKKLVADLKKAKEELIQKDLSLLLEQRKSVKAKAEETLHETEFIDISEIPYFKGLSGFEVLKDQSNNLIVPVLNDKFEIQSVQKINLSNTSQKFFQKNAETAGNFHALGITSFKDISSKDCVYFCEGFRTGVIAHLALEAPVIVCFSSNNYSKVLPKFREQFRHNPFCVLADDDSLGSSTGGLDSAKNACKSSNAVFVLPEFDKHDNSKSDFFDMYQEQGFFRVRNYLRIFDAKKVRNIARIPNVENGFFEKVELKSGGEKEMFDLDSVVEFLRLQKRILSVEGDKKGFFAYNGSHFVYKSIDSLNNFINKVVKKNLNYKSNYIIKDIKELVATSHSVSGEYFDRDSNNLVNFENGVLDFKNNKLYPHDLNNKFLYTLPFSWKQGTECEEFQAVLERVLPGEQDQKDLLCEFIGYALSGDDYWKAGALTLFGDGNNGKSTVLKIISMLFNDESISHVKIAHLKDRNYVLALQKSLINIDDESHPKSLMQSDEFKSFSDGGVVHARANYREAVSFRNKSKFIFSCNHLPTVKDDSKGLFRRLNIIHFDQDLSRTLGKPDPGLMDKIQKERSGIFNFCIEKYKAAKEKREFTTVRKSEQIKSEMRLESCPVRMFVDEFGFRACDNLLEYNNSNFIAGSEVFKSFIEWSAESNLDVQGRVRNSEQISKNSFSRKFKNIVNENVDSRFKIESVNKKFGKHQKKSWRNLVREGLRAVEEVSNELQN